MTQFVSPDDEHDVLETCRVKNINKYIEKLCVMLVIYQESLHDARSTKYKILWVTAYGLRIGRNKLVNGGKKPKY